MRWIPAATVLLCAFGALAGPGVEEGREAYARGDHAEALRHFEPAARDGDPEAQFHLGFLYAEGLGVERDLERALDWYRRAAEQGHVQARFNLGHAYEHGTGVPPDPARAAAWYEQAAEQGLAKAQYRAACLYEQGIDDEPDLVKAHQWFTLAGRAKFADAKKRKRRVAKRMTPYQIAASELQVRLWKQRRKEARAK